MSATFDSLHAPDLDAVVGQLLLRCPAGAGDWPLAGYEELADELFLTYDAVKATYV